MRDEAFCYIALLRRGESLTEVVKLLPKARRAAIEDMMKRMGEMSAAELRSRWRQMRQFETDELSKRAVEEAGLRFDLMPPFVQDWIGERTRNVQ